jgi:MFS family permease
MQTKNQFFRILIYVAVALGLRFLIVGRILEGTEVWWLQAVAIVIIFGIGIGYVFRGTAKVIEETTDVLKDRTKLAGGFLQAFGTAFPDMVIGVVAAFISLQVRDTDYVRAINLAIIAASTTFGSNIYNILHATWCIYRQNLANIKHKVVLMFPFFKVGGSLKPLEEHDIKPSVEEMDGAIRVLTALTMLTAFVAISMVLFGQVKGGEEKIAGDLYQLILPVGIALFILCVGVLYYFRKSHRPESPTEEIIEEERYYGKQGTWRIWLDLVLSGVAILFAAESMVKTMEVFSHLTHIPFVITGVMAGLIGCFGEMIVVHNFSVSPKGRIGDAVVGVAMDNIVTTLGAAIVAIMGGIFLGSNALILIFIIILTANTLLIEQISKLKNSLQGLGSELT